MFVFLIMILLFLKFTSEVEDIKPYFDTKKTKKYVQQQVKESIYENKKSNLSKHESSPPHLVMDEDPEFPLYKDYQILLDNRDAEISAQVKGIKRNAILQNPISESKDYEFNIENKLNNSLTGNKKEIKRTNVYFKFRKKRNLDKRMELKTNQLKRSSFYDQTKEEEQSYYKSLDLKDLSEYRPSHECFLKLSTKRSSHGDHPPTMLFDDYFHEEPDHSNNNTSQTNTQIATPMSSGGMGNNQALTKRTTEDVCKKIATYTPINKGTTTHAPERKLDAILKKLSNHSLVNGKSSTKSSIITLRHKEPCNEAEEVSTKPIIQRVIDLVPKPTDKVPGENANGSAAVKHKKVYPIRHKGGDPGNHYYHGKHPHLACEHKDFNTKKNETNHKPGLLSDVSKSDEFESTFRLQNTTGKPLNTAGSIEPFIAKRKFGQARGKNVAKMNNSNLSSHENKYCSVHSPYDIKEILPQRFHKEYFNLTIQPMHFPTPVTSISKVRKKPKEQFSLCSANKTNIVKTYQFFYVLCSFCF